MKYESPITEEPPAAEKTVTERRYPSGDLAMIREERIRKENGTTLTHIEEQHFGSVISRIERVIREERDDIHETVTTYIDDCYAPHTGMWEVVTLNRKIQSVRAWIDGAAFLKELNENRFIEELKRRWLMSKDRGEIPDGPR